MTSNLAMLALVTDAFGGRGGIAQYNRDLFSAVAGGAGSQCGVSITVVPRYAPDQAVTPRGIRQVPPEPGRIAYAMTTLVVALTRKVDLVFCGHLYMVTLAALIARLKRAKLVVQAHGIEAWPHPSRLQRVAVEKACLVLCVSRYTRARVLDWAGIKPERVAVLPNTVGNAFTPGKASPLRAALGLEDKRVLLTVGRMDSRERYKGHDRVIQTLPELLSGGHDVQYVVIGDGDDRARLERLARDTGVGKRVHFLGVVKGQSLIDAYRAADLFVMPSTGEGFGIAFLEAMASGTPALGLAVAGACDALAEGKLGLTAAESDFSIVLAQALEKPKPDGQALAAATKKRFGHEAFRLCVERTFSRLCDLKAT